MAITEVVPQAVLSVVLEDVLVVVLVAVLAAEVLVVVAPLVDGNVFYRFKLKFLLNVLPSCKVTVNQ